MRILYLTHRIPYPPNKGDKIRSYHHVRHLARSHEVHLLSFVDEPSSAYAGWETLRSECASVDIVPLSKRSALARGIKSLAAGRSLSEGYFGATAMARAIARLTGAHRFDLACAFSSTMAQYLPACGALHTLADFVDVDSEKWRQYGEDASGLLRFAYRLEARRMRAFETAVSAHASSVAFVSADEARLFRSFCPPHTVVNVIPNGVDTEYFCPYDAPPADRPTVLFTGALDYRPNIEAVLHAARQIMPLVRRDVPTAQLVAVGHRPGGELIREAERHPDLLRIAGSVPDVRPYFANASVYLAPLRVARGVQNKILEAMAMRVPVVASPAALVGIDAQAGHHALAGSSTPDLARAVSMLLQNPDQRRALADRAARLVHERYEWSANLELLDACIAAQFPCEASAAASNLPTPSLDASPSCSRA